MAGGLKKKRRIQLIVIGFAALIVATGLIIFAAGEGIEFFRSPTQVVADQPKPNEVFRLGGLVEEGSVIQTGETTVFTVTDGNASVQIQYTGLLPDLFREGQGMIGTGQLKDGVFVASELLAKHDETYMPKEVADALKEQGVYQPATE